jgi:hypothetical protein
VGALAAPDFIVRRNEKMSRYYFALAAVAAILSIGCSRGDSEKAKFSENEILKISVLKSGEIQADNKVVSLEVLDSLLAANAQKNGVVWYYR